ncbi:hypothetical protein [Pseudopedobacter saltans]|uniref:hypothetical protein n=1 Tax=Pseudopedobacter saltans TaxID=151895 RepID=UPI00031D6ACD|nr:hypothetical protein [Pseudopedobacter saltans]
MNYLLDFDSLKSFWGVKLISNELGRIAYVFIDSLPICYKDYNLGKDGMGAKLFGGR